MKKYSDIAQPLDVCNNSQLFRVCCGRIVAGYTSNWSLASRVCRQLNELYRSSDWLVVENF